MAWAVRNQGGASKEAVVVTQEVNCLCRYTCEEHFELLPPTPQAGSRPGLRLRCGEGSRSGFLLSASCLRSHRLLCPHFFLPSTWTSSLELAAGLSCKWGLGLVLAVSAQ